MLCGTHEASNTNNYNQQYNKTGAYLGSIKGGAIYHLFFPFPLLPFQAMESGECCKLPWRAWPPYGIWCILIKKASGKSNFKYVFTNNTRKLKHKFSVYE